MRKPHNDKATVYVPVQQNNRSRVIDVFHAGVSLSGEDSWNKIEDFYKVDRSELIANGWLIRPANLEIYL
jgi:hypothetical protein